MMQEKNLQRANEICTLLSSYRDKIYKIKETKEFVNAMIRVKFFNKERKQFVSDDLNISSLGNDVLKFIINQERLRLEGRILELEAELSKL